MRKSCYRRNWHTTERPQVELYKNSDYFTSFYLPNTTWGSSKRVGALTQAQQYNLPQQQ